MSYRLYVRPMPATADAGETPEIGLFNWVLYDAGGDAQAQGNGDSRDTIEQTLSQNGLEGVLLVGLIPGDEAMFCVADIPAKQSRFINQALPYAVEEQVAQDIDNVHLALGQHTDAGFQVAAVDRSRMMLWLELFSGWAHTRLDAIYPDAALLPTTEGGWSICLDRETVMMASDRGEWLSMQSTNLGMFAHTLAAPPSEDVVAEVPVVIYGTGAEFDQQTTVLDGLLVQDRLSVRREPLDLVPLALLAHAHHHNLCSPINLCQRDFSVNGAKTNRLRPWKPLIAVAAVWFVIQVTLEAGMGFYYEQQAQDLREQAMSVYQNAFPDDQRTHAGNVRRVLEGQMRMVGSDGPDADFVTLMKYTGEQYSSLAGTGSVTFNSINYSESRGELVVDVRAQSYDRLSSLRNGLVDKGLNAKIGSVVNESSGARGRLTVSGG